MKHPLRPQFEASLAERAKPIDGIKVLLWGFSGRGFPGGDGVAEALEWLPRAGVHVAHATEHDPDRYGKLSQHYDVSIVCNTRVGAVLKYDQRVWSCAEHSAYWFWDLRPADVATELRGRPTHVFISYRDDCTSPAGVTYSPKRWQSVLGCPVGYMPQAAPLRDSLVSGGGPRILFIGDLGNATYHYGRQQFCDALGVTVINERERTRRLDVESQMPSLYPRARYCLSMSPLAPGYTSVRTYSILACGGLLLLHRFPGADNLFADGINAALFDDIDGARSRVAELDADAPARQRIANAGRALHATRHTVAHRVVEICRQVTGVDSRWL